MWFVTFRIGLFVTLAQLELLNLKVNITENTKYKKLKAVCISREQ